MLFVIVFVFSVIKFAYMTCPNGFVLSLSNPTICYYFETQKLNWITADQNCTSIGGNLVSIHNMFDNMQINGEAATRFTDSTSGEFWIGGNNVFTPNTWTWMDKTSFDFTDWDKGQPVSTTGNNCAAVKLQGGTWIADDCYKTNPSVCAITVSTTTTVETTTTKPKSCRPSWTYYVVNGTNGYCYKVFDNATWIDAEKNCNIEGANLASVHTLDESLFLANLAYWLGAEACQGLNMAWIGGYTDDGNAHWYWTDKTPFNYHPWAGGHPWLSLPKTCVLKYLTTECGNHATSIDNYKCDSVLAKYICKKAPE